MASGVSLNRYTSDEGSLFAAYDNTDDAFVSPPLQGGEKAAQWIAENREKFWSIQIIKYLNFSYDEWLALIEIIRTNKPDIPNAAIEQWKRSIRAILTTDSIRMDLDFAIRPLLDFLEKMKVGPDFRISLLREQFHKRLDEITRQVEGYEAKYAISSAAFQKAISSIHALQTGNDITEDEAQNLCNVTDFMEAVMHWHQSNDMTLFRRAESRVEELGLTEIYTKDEERWDIQSILEDCMETSYAQRGRRKDMRDKGMSVAHMEDIDLEDTSMIVEKRKLSGHYLQKLFELTKRKADKRWKPLLQKLGFMDMKF